jgi:hypothetical protein
MMRNLNVHNIIIRLLKDGLYVLEDSKNEMNNIILGVFSLCNEFLIKFCMNDNK